MKNRGNLLLAAVFLAGLLGLWWADRAHVPTRMDRDRADGRVLPGILDTRPEELVKIEIDGGPEPIVFERTGPRLDRWQMVAPLNVAADPTKVESLAFNLKSLVRRPESEAREGADPASFGLAPPGRTVKLWGKATDAPLATLEVGRVSLDRRFVRPGGSTAIEAVDARTLGLVDLAPAQWRDREVFRVPSFEVDEVTIRAADRERPLKLHRDRDAWRVVEPIKALADGTKLDGLAADLAALRVTDDARFVADNVRDLAKFGLDKPTLTISVEAGRGDLRRSPQILHVGGRVPGADGLVYARRDDQDDVIALDGRSLRGVVADPSAYRDNRVADVDPKRVTAFQIEADGHTFAVGRFGKEWAITQPQPARADVPAVVAFLKSLTDLKTSAFLAKGSVPDAGVDPALLTLRVWQAPLPGSAADSASSEEKARPQLTLMIGRRDAGRKAVYARTDDDPLSLLALPEGSVSFLPRNSLGFRSRLVLAIDPEQLDRVAFEADGRTTILNAPIFKIAGPGKTLAQWWLGKPVTAPADMEAVERLFKLLSGLRANSLVADHVDEPARYGFDHPLLKVTCSRPPPSAKEKTTPAGLGPLRIPSDDLTLLIGKAIPDRLGIHYAMIVGESLVFAVGGDVLSVLDSEWHDRRILSFPGDQARQLSVTWPERRIDFTVNSGSNASTPDWVFAGAVDAPDFEPVRAKAVVSALADLKTTRFIQYDGPILAASGLNPPRVEIRVGLANGVTPPTLRIGNSIGQGNLLATTAPGNSGPIFVVPEAVFGAWSRAPRHQGDLPDDVFAP